LIVREPAEIGESCGTGEMLAAVESDGLPGELADQVLGTENVAPDRAGMEDLDGLDRRTYSMRL